jgi:hypothetical protein
MTLLKLAAFAALAAAAQLAPLPAQARMVGMADGGAVLLRLYDDKAACPAGTSLARWTQREGEVEGCWFSMHDRVWIFWNDGDHHGIPRQAFRFESI